MHLLEMMHCHMRSVHALELRSVKSLLVCVLGLNGHLLGLKICDMCADCGFWNVPGCDRREQLCPGG